MPCNDEMESKFNPLNPIMTNRNGGVVIGGGLSPIPNFTKLTRSASSNAPASRESSLPSTRPQSMRSISGSIDANTIGAETTTASPLNTPGDGPLDDPLSIAGKRAMTASPSAFERPFPATQNAHSSNIDHPDSISYPIRKNAVGLESLPNRSWTGATVTLENSRNGSTNPMDELTQRAQHLAIQDISNENRTRLNVHGAERQPTSPSISHTNISAERMSRSNSGIGPGLNIEGNEHLSEEHLQRQFNQQGQPGGEGTQASDASSLATMNAPEHSQEAFLQYQQQYHQPFQGGMGQIQQAEQPAMRMPFPPPQTYAFPQPVQQYPATGYPAHQLPLNQAPYSSPLSQNSGAGIHQTDSSSPLGATPPDPYAPYGMPSGPPSIPSGSVPQSPTFLPPNLAPGQMQQIDPTSYMYGYNTGPPGMMVRPPYSVSSSGTIGGGDQGQTNAGAGATIPYFMGVNALPGAPVMYNPNASPPLPSGMPFNSDRHQRKTSHISQGSFGASNPQQFGVQKPPMWAASPSSPVGQNFAHGYANVGGQSPNWAQNDPRTANMHRRMISGPYGTAIPATVPFIPSSPTMYRPTPPSSRGMHSRTPSSMSFGSSFSRMHMPENNVQRSPLLEEFRTRQNRGRKFELHDVLGSVVEFSSDQHGSRFIQEKLTSASDEDLQLIFDEIYPKANALMTDVFGNYVIQKLIENGTDEMRSKLVESMRNQIHSLSLSTYGCRVVQRALDYVEPEERLNIADELRDQIIPCVRDQNANHVIQKILERVSPTSQIDYIPQAFRGNVYSLAAHCYSCRVLQRIFEFCDKAQSRPLLEELLEDADRLMRDQYGNYVIQWILSKAGRNEKDRIIRLAKGNILRLSKHKFASNVVESIIAAASEEDRYHFIEEIMLEVPASELQPQMEGAGPGRQTAVHSAVPGSVSTMPYGVAPDQTGMQTEKPIAAVVMMRDQYGNYVLQRFLELAEGQQKQKLVMLIKPVLNNLKRSSSGYTKHLVAIERLLDTTTTRNNAATMTNNPSHSNAGMSSYQ